MCVCVIAEQLIDHLSSFKMWVALKRAFFVGSSESESLTSESVQGTSLTFEGVDNVHGCDSLPLGMLCVGDSVTDDVLKEHFEYTTGLFVDQSRDTFDTSSPGQTSDGRLGDTLDVITQHFSVTLGAPLSQSFSSFTTSTHVC